MTPAQFNVVAITSDVVLIHDTNGGASVTNDAERVVRNLHAAKVLQPGYRLIYRDSDMRYDEIKHDNRGGFTGFQFLAELDQTRYRQLADNPPGSKP